MKLPFAFADHTRGADDGFNPQRLYKVNVVFPRKR